MGHSLGLGNVLRIADRDQGHHAHAVMQLALHAIDTWHIEGDCQFFVIRRSEGGSAGREHSIDALHIVPLVGWDEPDLVTWRDLHECRLEHHGAVCTLVEHLHLDLGCRCHAAVHCEESDGVQQRRKLISSHFEFPIRGSLEEMRCPDHAARTWDRKDPASARSVCALASSSSRSLMIPCVVLETSAKAPLTELKVLRTTSVPFDARCMLAAISPAAASWPDIACATSLSEDPIKPTDPRIAVIEETTSWVAD